MLLLGVVSFSNAQSWNEGDQVINVGLGFGSNLYNGSNSVRIPPVSGSFEYGIRDQWSVGGVLAIAGSKYEFGSGPNYYQYNYNYVLLAGKGAYHIYSDYTWDTYVAATLGFNIVTGGYTGVRPTNHVYDPDGTSLHFGLVGGARYYFNDQIAAFGELGFSYATLNLGVSIKL